MSTAVEVRVSPPLPRPDDGIIQSRCVLTRGPAVLNRVNSHQHRPHSWSPWSVSHRWVRLERRVTNRHGTEYNLMQIMVKGMDVRVLPPLWHT